MVLMYDGTLATGGHDSCIRLLPESGPAMAPPKPDALSSVAPDAGAYVPSVESLSSAPERALAAEQLHVPMQNVAAVAKNMVSLAPVRASWAGPAVTPRLLACHA